MYKLDLKWQGQSKELRTSEVTLSFDSRLEQKPTDGHSWNKLFNATSLEDRARVTFPGDSFLFTLAREDNNRPKKGFGACPAWWTSGFSGITGAQSHITKKPPLLPRGALMRAALPESLAQASHCYTEKSPLPLPLIPMSPLQRALGVFWVSWASYISPWGKVSICRKELQQRI